MKRRRPDDGGQVFPRPGFNIAKGDDYEVGRDGITLRDWFATQVIEGVLRTTRLDDTPETIARRCYTLADALLTARGRT